LLAEWSVVSRESQLLKTKAVKNLYKGIEMSLGQAKSCSKGDKREQFSK
jgi:hypothetical protein